MLLVHCRRDKFGTSNRKTSQQGLTSFIILLKSIIYCIFPNALLARTSLMLHQGLWDLCFIQPYVRGGKSHWMRYSSCLQLIFPTAQARSLFNSVWKQLAITREHSMVCLETNTHLCTHRKLKTCISTFLEDRNPFFKLCLAYCWHFEKKLSWRWIWC